MTEIIRAMLSFLTFIVTIHNQTLGKSIARFVSLNAAGN